MAEPDPLPDEARLAACLAARGLAVPPEDHAAVLAGVLRLAEAARRLRAAEEDRRGPMTLRGALFRTDQAGLQWSPARSGRPEPRRRARGAGPIGTFVIGPRPPWWARNRARRGEGGRGPIRLGRIGRECPLRQLSIQPEFE
jgi:hypothetical protein